MHAQCALHIENNNIIDCDLNYKFLSHLAPVLVSFRWHIEFSKWKLLLLQVWRHYTNFQAGRLSYSLCWTIRFGYNNKVKILFFRSPFQIILSEARHTSKRLQTISINHSASLLTLIGKLSNDIAKRGNCDSPNNFIY